MAPSNQLKALVDQMPDADERGMYTHIVVKVLSPDGGKKGKPKVETHPIDKDKIDKAVAEIHKGGRENIAGLAGLLVEPGKGEDYKARYAMHGLALRVCQLKQADKNDAPRREFALALASQLAGDRPKAVKAFLLQELQAAGGKEVVETLGQFLTDEDLCDPAARAIAAIRDGAVEQFRAALPKAKGFCRLTLLQNLGVLRDTASAGAMRTALGDPDREIRLVAAWGLANMGDAASVDLLLKTADAQPGWERTEMTKACLLLAENLADAGKGTEAAKIRTHLRSTRPDPGERYVREAAER